MAVILDLLIISYKLLVSYTMTSGCKEKSVWITQMHVTCSTNIWVGCTSAARQIDCNKTNKCTNIAHNYIQGERNGFTIMLISSFHAFMESWSEPVFLFSICDGTLCPFCEPGCPVFTCWSLIDCESARTPRGILCGVKEVLSCPAKFEFFGSANPRANRQFPTKLDV